MLLRRYLNKRPSVHAELTTWRVKESVSLLQLLSGLVFGMATFRL